MCVVDINLRMLDGVWHQFPSVLFRPAARQLTLKYFIVWLITYRLNNQDLLSLPLPYNLSRVIFIIRTILGLCWLTPSKSFKRGWCSAQLWAGTHMGRAIPLAPVFQNRWLIASYGTIMLSLCEFAFLWNKRMAWKCKSKCILAGAF